MKGSLSTGVDSGPMIINLNGSLGDDGYFLRLSVSPPIHQTLAADTPQRFISTVCIGVA